MGFTRKLPNSDDTREATMSTAKARKDDALPADNVFSQATSDALDVELPKFITVRKNLKDAEENDHQAVEIFAPLLQALKIRCSCGLQLINFKIDLQDAGFTAATRALYGMDLTGRLPSLSSEDDIIQAANNFINGETQRVAQGGTGLTDITKASVEALLDSVIEKRLVKQTTGNALGQARVNIDNRRQIVDPLIKTMWADIEHAAQGMPVGPYHEFCHSWGMDFVHTSGFATLNVRVQDVETGLPMAGVALRIGKADGTGGTKAVTNHHGEQIMETKNFKPTSIIAEMVLYDTLVTDITLAEDEVKHVVLKMKKSAT